MFADNIIEYLNVPMFTVQSLYDSLSIVNILGIRCAQNYSLSNCSPK